MTVKNDTARTVSIDEIVSSAQVSLGLNTDADRIIMYEWVSVANREIGLGIQDQMQEIIDITDFTFPAPCNMLQPLQLRLIGENRTTGAGTVAPFYDQEDWLRQDGSLPNRRSYVSVQLQGNTFVLSNNITSDNFQQAELKYIGTPLDDQGFPLVYEHNKSAIVQYIEYSYLKRLRRRERGQATAPPQSEIDAEYQKWLRKKAAAYTNKKMPNKLRWDDINRKWNTLLPNQKRKTTHPDSRAAIGGFHFFI